ncbi:MAG: hypothetical protein HQM03_20290, partial [Magnetococcales bacterium]|nr:hypothetical protein [Magnetococcales bacterium]
MYLNGIYLVNNGPIQHLDLAIQLMESGTPKPLILVGENGSGKTCLLSLIADALMLAASNYYTDVVVRSVPDVRTWFRLLGPATVSSGCPGSCAILQFQHENQMYFYTEKVGKISAKDIKEQSPSQYKSVINWNDDNEALKKISLDHDVSKIVFESGVYFYAPSSRTEIPHWLNQESLLSDDFNVNVRQRNKLHKNIYLERGLDKLQQWILSLIIDVKAEPNYIDIGNGSYIIGEYYNQERHKNIIIWNVLNSAWQKKPIFLTSPILKHA